MGRAPEEMLKNPSEFHEKSVTLLSKLSYAAA